MPGSKPFVRPYEARDYDAVVHVCAETVDSSLQREPARTIATYNWCRAFLTLPSASAFVLDDGSGTAVGYAIGTYDTKLFVKEWREQYLPSLKDDETLQWDEKMQPASEGDEEERQRRGLLKHLWSPDVMLMSQWPSLVENYSAHMHINILAPYQRQGHGTGMITALLNRLKERGANGIHLGMVATNDNAHSFYQHVGFARFDEVMDDGFSGEKGRYGTADEVGTIWLVKKL